MTIVSSFVLHSMQVLIKFIDSKMTVFVHTRMSSKLLSQKMADTSKDKQRRNTPHHSTSLYNAHGK